MIASVTSHKDFGIIFDNNLKFYDHTIEVTAKANRLLGLIRKSFEYLEVKLFVTIVRPTWNIVTQYGDLLSSWTRGSL